MIQPVFVHADILGNTHSVGRLWAHFRRGVQSASFEYDKSWLTKPGRFSLEPALKLGAGSFHTRSGKSLFGAIGDSAPDRWGRILIRRKARHLGREKLTAQISLTEIDYLLQVNDHTRQGALRFSWRKTGHSSPGMITKTVVFLLRFFSRSFWQPQIMLLLTGTAVRILRCFLLRVPPWEEPDRKRL